MNPASFVVWCVAGAIVLLIVIRVVVLVVRVLTPPKRDEGHIDSPFYRPRR